MVRVQTPSILVQIRNARSYAEQATALRSLKNEIIGHAQKKEAWVGYAVLDPIVKMLAGSRSQAKMNGKDARFHFAAGGGGSLAEEEGVRVQALQLLASFANGGAAFLAPLHAAGALPAVLANICPFTNPPQIVLGALRTLKNIADAADLAAPGSLVDMAALADAVFAPSVVDSLQAILSASPSNPTALAQIELAAELIHQLCKEERHQLALGNAGILDALANRLASFGVADGVVIPGAEFLGSSDGLGDFLPEPAPRGANLAVILEAVSAVIGDSRVRACMLLCTPAILAVFPTARFSPSREARAPWVALETTGLGYTRRQNLSAMDYLLPAVPIHHSRNVATYSFPSFVSPETREAAHRYSMRFGSGGPSAENSKFDVFGAGGEAPDNDEIESPIIPWLEYLVRSRDDRVRLVAASVLASLVKAGFGSKTLRETSLGLLVVPVLLDLIKRHMGASTEMDGAAGSTSLPWTILQRTPTVLSRLILDSEYLQKAAFDCDAVKTLSKLLKDAYEPVPASSQFQAWSPNPAAGPDPASLPPSCRLGPPGGPPMLAFRVRVREGALRAIAALAGGKEEYRKAFVDQEVVPYVVESLNQHPGKPRNFKERAKSDKPGEPAASSASFAENAALYGVNPVTVIIAACHAVRMLSRSISILRTSLVDYGVAMPMFQFLKHPDEEVQIAATAAMCNLVTEVSPMRESLTEAGILKILCEHAHSHNAALRLNALWALKHFVIAVGSKLKKACLEELESGWLVQLICDTDDEALFSMRTMAEKQGSLSPDRDDDDDDDDDDEEDDEMDEDMEIDQTTGAADEQRRSWLFTAPSQQQQQPAEVDGKRAAARVRQAEAKLAAVRDSELNPARKARHEELAIQEQGLDFIRNLIGEPWSTGSGVGPHETTEMIDFLFQELGQDRLFAILASKLRPRYVHAYSRRSAMAAAVQGGGGSNNGTAGSGAGPAGRSSGDAASGSGSSGRVIYPQARIIAAVIYILVHMAASAPRHRQVVIAQTDLLGLVGAHASNRDREVRLALCHLVTSLTVPDDKGDTEACAARAAELARLGFLSKLETLEREDSELQVKEQAKTAAWQMRQFASG